MSSEEAISKLQFAIESGWGKYYETTVFDDINSHLISKISQLGDFEGLAISLMVNSSIPVEIGLLTNIRKLTITGEAIAHIPKEIGALDNLHTLNIRKTSITGLPEEIANLINLRVLDVSNNALSSLPEGMEKLSKLGQLQLSRNNLSDLPKSIGELKNLRVLLIDHNPILSFDEEIDLLKGLSFLALDSKQSKNLVDAGQINFCEDSEDRGWIHNYYFFEELKKNKSVKELFIPEGETQINREAYKGRRLLEKVTLPDTVDWIRLRAFENCVSLQEISFSGNDHWIDIAPGAFKGCKSLKYLKLPYGVTAIQKETFKDCSSLEEIIIPDSVVLIEENAFENCSSLRKISLPWIMEKLDRTILSGSCPADEVTYIRNPDYRLEGDFLVSRDGQELKKFYYNVDRDFVVVPDTITKIAGFALRSSYKIHDPQYYSTGSYFGHSPDPSINKKIDLKLIISSHVKDFSEDAFSDMFFDTIVQVDEKLAKREFGFFCKKLWCFEIINEERRVIGIFDLPYSNTKKAKADIDSPEQYDQLIFDNLFKEVDPVYTNKKLEIALNRLKFPYQLTAPARDRYIDFMKSHKKAWIPILIKKNDIATLTEFSDILLTPANIDEVIDQANSSKNTEMVAFLMNQKNKNFGIDPIKNKHLEIKPPKVPKLLVPGTVEYTRKYFSFTGLKEGKLTVQGYKGHDTTITLPTELNGVPITVFNPRKSFGVAEEIIIPEGYTEINSNVDNFYHLWKYEYPGRLKKLTIADSVTDLQSRVFAKIHTLEEVRIGRGITALDYSLFVGCENLAHLILPDTIISLSVRPVTDGHYGNTGDFCIHAPKGSYAIKYAKEHRIKYVEI